MTKATTRKQAGKTPPAKKTEEKLLYVGPSIYGVARTGSVYTGIPDGAQEARKDAPDIVHLFIPLSDYPKAEKMISTRSGYIGLAYKHAEALAEKMRRGGR